MLDLGTDTRVRHVADPATRASGLVGMIGIFGLWCGFVGVLAAADPYSGLLTLLLFPVVALLVVCAVALKIDFPYAVTVALVGSGAILLISMLLLAAQLRLFWVHVAAGSSDLFAWSIVISASSVITAIRVWSAREEFGRRANTQREKQVEAVRRR